MNPLLRCSLSMTGVLLLGAGCAPTPVAPQERTYDNAYLQLTVPADWQVAAASDKGEGAITVTRGKYTLFVNPQAQQASGVEGGRFAEVGQGWPSVDAVVLEQPSECGRTLPSEDETFEDFVRRDYVIDASGEKEWCAAPSNGQTVWFFSYLTRPAHGGYFNYYAGPEGETKALVVTMSYNGTDVNALPPQGSADLEANLKAMSDIASTLIVKETFARD